MGYDARAPHVCGGGGGKAARLQALKPHASLYPSPTAATSSLPSQLQRFKEIGVLEGQEALAAAKEAEAAALKSAGRGTATELAEGKPAGAKPTPKPAGPRVRRQPDGVTWRTCMVVAANCTSKGGPVLKLTVWVTRGKALVCTARSWPCCVSAAPPTRTSACLLLAASHE
jgi:hypothetical protein